MTTPEQTWDKVVADFRQLCLLRRQKKWIESDIILNSDLPRSIATWSESAQIDPTAKKSRLDSMFQAEQRRIDDAWFAEKKGTPKKHETLHLGCVARFAEEKGVDLLLRAVAGTEHVTLDLAGDGPEEAALKKQVARLGIEHRVRFLGRTGDVAHVYRVIDALVLPSRTVDPFGMVVAEAMAMGVPCLVTDACGIASCL